MRSAEAARSWVEWFAGPDHREISDRRLVTKGAPAEFLATHLADLKGSDDRPVTATAIQRCLRPEDMQLVGRTGAHGTFFQMATAISVGVASVADLARTTWALTTTDRESGGLGIAAERLQVHVSDTDTAKIWTSEIGLGAAQIVLSDAPAPGATNGHGETPSTSVVVLQRQRGPATRDVTRQAVPPLELWSLHGRHDAQAAAVGLGVERVTMAAENIATFAETDQLRPVLDRIALLTQTGYDDESRDDISGIRLRVAADHARAALMLADLGVSPAASGHGLVLRKLVRRTTRAMRLLGLDAAAFAELLPTVRDVMAPCYPSVRTNYERIEEVILAEEALFRGTSGRRVEPTSSAPGTDGAAAEEPATTLDIDRTGVLAALRDRSGPTDWHGYEMVRTSARVIAILDQGGMLDTAAQGTIVDVVLDRTPFFAMRSGQSSDRGELLADGLRATVLDARWFMSDVVVHRVRVDDGEIRVGATLTAEVDADRRVAACQAHTATHVLRAVLRQQLGEQAVRGQSSDEPGRLVVEMTGETPWSDQVAESVEWSANEVLRRDGSVTARLMSREDALAAGAIDSHDPDGSDMVRVVDLDEGVSREICGGTHVVNASQIGLITLTDSWITPEGHRAIEAMCGLDGLRRLTRDRDLVRDLSGTARVTREQLLARVDRMLASDAEGHGAAIDAAARVLEADAEAAAARAVSVAGTWYTEARTAHAGQARQLAALICTLLEPTRPGVVVVTGGAGHRLSVVVSVNDFGVAAGLSADDLISSGIRTHGETGPGLAQGPVDSKQRRRAIARIRTKVGVVSGSLAT